MSFLAEALGSAKAAYKGAVNDIAGVGKAVGNAAHSVATSTVADLVGPLAGGKVGQILNTAGSAAVGALGQAVGNVALNGAKAVLSGNVGDLGNIITGELSSVGGFLKGPGGGMLEGYSLLGAQARADPLLEYNWYCVLPPIQSAYGSTTLGWNYVEECTVPYRRFETRSVYDQGFPKHYAGKYSVDQLRLGVYMDAQAKSLQYFRAWQAAMMQPFPATEAASNGGVFTAPMNYKKDVRIYLMNPRRQVIAQILCTGCWPTDINSLNLTSAGGGRLIQNVTLSVDDVFLDFTGAAADIISEAIDIMGSKLSNLDVGDLINTGLDKAADFANDAADSISSLF